MKELENVAVSHAQKLFHFKFRFHFRNSMKSVFVHQRLYNLWSPHHHHCQYEIGEPLKSLSTCHIP